MSYKFLVFSPKAIEALQKLDLDAHQAYPIKVVHQGEELSYFALHFSFGRQKEFIDWEKSEFGIANRKDGYKGGAWTYIKELSFGSWEEYKIELDLSLGTDYVLRNKTAFSLIKQLFDLEGEKQLPYKGLNKVTSFLMLTPLAVQLLIRDNHIHKRDWASTEAFLTAFK